MRYDMKKTIFLLPFLMLASLSSMGQNVKHVSLDFSMDDFRIEQDNAGNAFVLSDAHNCFLKSDTLLPALPYIGYNVLIGSTDKYDNHVCSDSKSLFRSNVTMANNPEAIPTNILPSANGTKHAASYSQRTYPSEFVEFAGMNECDGYRILTFHVCPFEYDATSKRLSLRTHIDLDIQLRPSPSTSSSRTGNREDVRNIIRRIVVNPEDLSEQNVPAGDRSCNVLTKQQGFEYVIVTSNQFKSTFQELANWKSRKGIRSKVITVDDVLTYEGATTKEKIKRALADISGLSYVLLGGDTLNVPTCMCYIGYRENTDSITPADVYYSCLETKNWDNNGNGFYGELNDSVCLLPVLHVSRAPVSTVEDAQVFVDRIINYESAPDTTNWKDNILMCGTSLGCYDNSGQSDASIWGQMIYGQNIDPFWVDEQCIYFYDTFTSFDGNADHNFTADNLQIELAKGYTFVDVLTHGEKLYWQMEQGNSYHCDKAKILINCGYSIITTTACLTNAFDYYTAFGRCLSQRFINNPNSGILAYLGTSRENWGSGGEPFIMLSGGEAFEGRVYKNIFENKYHRLGKALTAVKEVYRESAMARYNTARKLFMGYNLMGDPEMPIYLYKPKSFQNVSIQVVNDSIYVDAGTGGFDICFINTSDSTDYYIARDIVDSLAVFGRLDGVFDVCITKPGYVPYITTCGDTYLQNITLTGMKTYETGNAMIGSNVTNKVVQGPVITNSGNTTLKASQSATITKDFEVKLGAKFTITNE